MASGKRRIGWLGRSLIALALLLFGAAIALFAAYRWSEKHHSVALLDIADSLFAGGLEARRASYGDDPAQHLLVFGSPGGEPKPILVFFHGGSWLYGSPEEYGFVARSFAPKGYAVVLAGYRLGKRGRFPAMLEDSAAAVAWAHAHAAEFGGDPHRIFLMGHSAGAYNAAMLALDRQWLGREGLDDGIVKGMIGLAGPYDFLPFDDPATLDAFGQWPRPAATQPTGFARADAPPMLLLTGTADTSVRPRNSAALARVLTQAGAPVKTVRFPGMGHVGILVTLALPPRWWDHRVHDAALAFLAENRDAGDRDVAPASAPVQSP